MPDITDINYAEQYQQTLIQAFPYALYFGELWATPANGRYEFTGPNTIHIPTINVKGRKDGNMDALTTKKRNFGLGWKTLELTRHRTWDTLLHPEQVNRTNGMATIANATQVMNQEQKFPEMSAYLVSKLYADYLEAGKTPNTTVPTVANILGIFDDMMVEMDDARVPRAGRILYTTPTIGKLLKEAQDLQRSVNVQTVGGAVKRQVATLDEVIVRDFIPKDLMKTAYDFDEGWEIGETAVQINMMLVHPDAVITPIKYSYAGLDAPTATNQGKYYYFEESFEDVFLLPLKEGGIAFNVAPAETTPDDGEGGDDGQEGSDEPQYTYTKVTSIDPSANPKTLGYYEEDGSGGYVQTDDETVTENKDYYERTEATG